jgi:hypothetical protein
MNIEELVRKDVHLTQNRNQWQALVNTIMKLGVPYKVGNFLIR